MKGPTEIPRYEIAERALDEIRTEIDQWRSNGKSHTGLLIDIAHILDLSAARLRMMSLRRRRPGASWLAKMGSFAYPRQFDGWWGDDPDPHMCIQVEFTDGPKAVRDRCIEIQMPDDHMERLARQMLDLVEHRKKAKEGRP